MWCRTQHGHNPRYEYEVSVHAITRPIYTDRPSSDITPVSPRTELCIIFTLSVRVHSGFFPRTILVLSRLLPSRPPADRILTSMVHIRGAIRPRRPSLFVFLTVTQTYPVKYALPYLLVALLYLCSLNWAERTQSTSVWAQRFCLGSGVEVRESLGARDEVRASWSVKALGRHRSPPSTSAARARETHKCSP